MGQQGKEQETHNAGLSWTFAYWDCVRYAAAHSNSLPLNQEVQDPFTRVQPEQPQLSTGNGGVKGWAEFDEEEPNISIDFSSWGC